MKPLMGRHIKPWYWGYCFQGAVILGISPIMLPLIASHAVKSASIGDFNAGLVVAMFYLGQFPAPFIGQLAERTQKFAYFYLSGYFLIAMGALLFITTQHLHFWLLFAFLQGLGAGASNTLTAMYIVEYQPKEEWDGSIGWLQTIYGTGQAIGLLIVAIIQAHPKWAMLLAGIMMLPGFFIGQIGIPKDKTSEALKSNRYQHTGKRHHAFFHHGINPLANLHFHPVHKLTSSLASFKSLWGLFGLFQLSWFLAMIAMWMVMNLLPLFFIDNYHISAKLSSFYYGIFAVIGIFLYAPSGLWSRRYGANKVLFVGILMLVISLLGMSLASYAQSKYLQYILAPLFFSLIPIGWSPLIVAGTSLTGEISSIGQGAGLGLFNANTAIASVLSSIMAGFLAQQYGYKSVAVTALIIGAIGMILFLPLLKLSTNEKR